MHMADPRRNRRAVQPRIAWTVTPNRILRCYRPWLIMLVVSLGFASARAASLSQAESADSRPVFDPVRFFSGHTRSSGVFENRAGEPTKRVRTETWGRMVGDELRMEQELFVDGEPRQRRSWRMRRLDAHHFEGTANDIIGKVRGEAYGNYFRWTFTLALKPGNSLFNVRMTQHMYLQPDGRTMVNRSTIRKLGVVVAQVTEQFRRDSSR